MPRTIRQLIISALSVFSLAWGLNTPSERLVGGNPIPPSSFPSIFIWSFQREDIEEEYCTAAKVGARWILTAAHCALGPSETGYGPWRRLPDMNSGKKIRISFSRNFAIEKKTQLLTVASVHFPPRLTRCLDTFQEDDAVCNSGRVPEPDVALIEVEPANGAFSKAPIIQVDTETLSANDYIVMTGYGAESDLGGHRPRLKSHPAYVASEPLMREVLRGTLAEIDGIPDWRRFFGSVGPLFSPTDAGLGSGDSGGPVLKANPWRIVGINSDGYCPLEKPACERASNNIFARLDNGDPNQVGTWLRGTLASRP